MHITEFENFFTKAGVKFKKINLVDTDSTETLAFFPEGATQALAVSQCNFLFSPAGNFIGTFADDMSYFEPKLEV